MQFNDHSRLRGQHAFLSASQSAWVNYNDDKLIEVYRAREIAVRRGIKLHAFAAEAIELGIKLPKSKKTLNMYINDAIGYKMTPEQVLYYSENAFGTADAISFKNGLLRIHDLKTGIHPANMRQLEVYAAFFCLEYAIRPHEIEMELRIYQNDEIIYHNPEIDDIVPIMDTVVRLDKLIKQIKEEEL